MKERIKEGRNEGRKERRLSGSGSFTLSWVYFMLIVDVILFTCVYLLMTRNPTVVSKSMKAAANALGFSAQVNAHTHTYTHTHAPADRHIHTYLHPHKRVGPTLVTKKRRLWSANYALRLALRRLTRILSQYPNPKQHQ